MHRTPEEPNPSRDRADIFERPMTRRTVVATIGAGSLVAATGAWGSTRGGVFVTRRPGGPKGWQGAERYQYGASSAPGRAVNEAKKLRKDGKAPHTIVVGMHSGAIGNYAQPFPKGAKSVAQVWEDETGIKLKFVGVESSQTYAHDTRLAATKEGSEHIVPLALTDIGDLAEAGLLADLGEYVAQYKPDWADPKWGYIGGAKTAKLFNYYRNKPFAVSQDCDVQVATYRRDLIESAAEGRAFKAKYGYDLDYPQTWDQWRDIAQFFQRPSKELFGTVELRSPAWGWINFVMRYVSTRNPVQYFFDNEMNPLLSSPQGVRALKSYVETTKYNSPNALSWIWSHEYTAMGAGRAVMCTNFPNVTKFVKKGSPLDKGFGKFLVSRPVPGFKVGKVLVRHPSLYFNNTLGVNAFAPKEAQRAAYLLLQWLSSGPIMTWLAANPAGYQDPGKVASFNDPLVEKTYGRSTLDAVEASIPAMAPPVSNLKGANEYNQVLDINLQKALSNQSSIEQTLEAIEQGWNKVTKKHGREQQAKAWVASKAAWPKRPGL